MYTSQGWCLYYVTIELRPKGKERVVYVGPWEGRTLQSAVVSAGQENNAAGTPEEADTYLQEPLP